MSIQVHPFPDANHSLSVDQAVIMTRSFRNDCENILAPSMKGNSILPFSETFNREAFDNLLAQAGCEGIRFYYGMDGDKKVHIIAVAVNSGNEDLIPAGAELLIENGIRCPQDCPPASLLNR